MSRNQHCPFKLKGSFTNKFINGFLFTLNEEQPLFFLQLKLMLIFLTTLKNHH